MSNSCQKCDVPASGSIDQPECEDDENTRYEWLKHLLVTAVIGFSILTLVWARGA